MPGGRRPGSLRDPSVEPTVDPSIRRSSAMSCAASFASMNSVLPVPPRHGDGTGTSTDSTHFMVYTPCTFATPNWPLAPWQDPHCSTPDAV